ncbi:MAG: nuclear transport factor 2 family protein [Parvibaculum sp.]
MTVTTPAGRLVRAFGDVEKMAALYAPGIDWSLSASLPYPRPMRGRDAVLAFNRSVWEEVYFPDCTVEILDEVGNDSLSAVRFIYRARHRATGRAYENEYTLFARAGAEGITEVFEALDTLAVFDQINGRPAGTSLARVSSD